MAFGELLRRLQHERTLLTVSRGKVGGDDLEGFVRGVSDELVLIESVIDLRQDGFSLIELDDVTFLGWGSDRFRAWEEILAPIEPAVPELDLSDWRAAVTSLGSSGMILSFGRERASEHRFQTCQSFESTYDVLVGKWIAPDGTENSSFAIQIEDITRIDFGSDFEEARRRIRALR